MVITQRLAADATILDLNGPLTLGEATALLRRHVDRLVERDTLHIILNFSAVPSVDSSGLGEIVRCQVVLSNQGGSLRLAGVGESLYRTLQVTRVLARLELLDPADPVLRGGDPSAGS